MEFRDSVTRMMNFLNIWIDKYRQYPNYGKVIIIADYEYKLHKKNKFVSKYLSFFHSKIIPEFEKLNIKIPQNKFINRARIVKTVFVILLMLKYHNSDLEDFRARFNKLVEFERSPKNHNTLVQKSKYVKKFVKDFWEKLEYCEEIDLADTMASNELEESRKPKYNFDDYYRIIIPPKITELRINIPAQFYFRRQIETIVDLSKILIFLKLKNDPEIIRNFETSINRVYDNYSKKN